MVEGVYEALVVGDGGLEGLGCPAVEGARVGPDLGGGSCPGGGIVCGVGRLAGLAGERGPVSPVMQGGAYVCPPVRPPLLGVSRVCPGG